MFELTFQKESGFQIREDLMAFSHMDTSMIDFPNHISCNIYFKGCNRPCMKHCQNGHLHEYQLCDIITIPNLLKEIEAVLEMNTLINGIVLTGGEPLMQSRMIYFLDRLKCRYPKMSLCLYTSYDFNEIPRAIKKHLSLIKCGVFDPQKLKKGYLSTSNQCFYERKWYGFKKLKGDSF